MNKKILVFGFLLPIVTVLSATTLNSNTNIHDKTIKKLSNIDKISPKIQQHRLPPPYQYLLSQPLLTQGIEKFYQRTAIIQKMYATKNEQNNTYSRAIFMLIDRNKSRNKPKLAQKRHETQVVELAFITINFKALSHKLIQNILYSDVPFGTLLTQHHIDIDVKGRSYFSVYCDKKLADLISCQWQSMIYGRTNTLMRKDNKKWLAQVVEILP